MLSLGTELFLAFWMASYSVGLPSGSPPPVRAATSMFLISLANILPRRASMTAFLCFVVAHLEWPLIGVAVLSQLLPTRRDPDVHHRPAAARGPDSTDVCLNCRFYRPDRRTSGREGGHRLCGLTPSAQAARAASFTRSQKSPCTRRSPVSSGWNDVAITAP